MATTQAARSASPSSTAGVAVTRTISRQWLSAEKLARTTLLKKNQYLMLAYCHHRSDRVKERKIGAFVML
ncbi:hypothetical protein ANCDUO_14874 [Ancylostoma duodenale]|uniref:Uncharacterized protein n=1 Tax=Ancylostoma duodenale TaxID=51022 RepID=A0A0C2G7W7_9BILA|nr:hypothetical protein ANCDUO_14874 [Ancylostoma duodenale]